MSGSSRLRLQGEVEWWTKKDDANGRPTSRCREVQREHHTERDQYRSKKNVQSTVKREQRRLCREQVR